MGLLRIENETIFWLARLKVNSLNIPEQNTEKNKQLQKENICNREKNKKCENRRTFLSCVTIPFKIKFSVQFSRR